MTPYVVKPAATPAEADLLLSIIAENPDATGEELFMVFAVLMAIGGIPIKPPQLQ